MSTRNLTIMKNSSSETFLQSTSSGRQRSLLAWFKANLSRLCAYYIVAEHHCSPPEDGRSWSAISSKQELSCHHYICPECGQQFHSELPHSTPRRTWWSRQNGTRPNRPLASRTPDIISECRAVEGLDTAGRDGPQIMDRWVGAAPVNSEVSAMSYRTPLWWRLGCLRAATEPWVSDDGRNGGKSNPKCSAKSANGSPHHLGVSARHPELHDFQRTCEDEKADNDGDALTGWGPNAAQRECGQCICDKVLGATVSSSVRTIIPRHQWQNNDQP